MRKRFLIPGLDRLRPFRPLSTDYLLYLQTKECSGTLYRPKKEDRSTKDMDTLILEKNAFYTFIKNLELQRLLEFVSVQNISYTFFLFFRIHGLLL